jgi:hypothetical protein
MPAKMTVSEAEAIELRYKELQIQDIEERIAERTAKKERIEEARRKQLADFKKGERERLRRQRVCKHRKGGMNNNFAQGNGANYSVNMNTYPDGRQVIFCTRCGKEVERPTAKLRKEDPERYKQMLEEWNEWSRYPTDNKPSGGKIFEVLPDAA